MPAATRNPQVDQNPATPDMDNQNSRGVRAASCNPILNRPSIPRFRPNKIFKAKEHHHAYCNKVSSKICCLLVINPKLAQLWRHLKEVVKQEVSAIEYRLFNSGSSSIATKTISMRKPVLIFLIALVAAAAVALVYSFSNKSNAMPEVKNRANPGFAVVELFTSEGCSSCPPADAAVAKLLAQHKENVYILSFHVDYWNRLGWKDPFSQALFSARQSRYAAHFSADGVYTPQVVVNGSSEFVGSSENKLNAAVENGLYKGTPSDLKISAAKTDNTVTVSYTISEPHVVLLNLALVQPEAATVVQRGENSGRTLRHVNVVRVLRTADATGKGYFTIKIPPEIINIPLQLIAYTQSKQNFNVLGAALKKL
ncbi:MAG: DUF1223 domain-containing protein [Chitinophagaceae bacterium]